MLSTRTATSGWPVCELDVSGTPIWLWMVAVAQIQQSDRGGDHLDLQLGKHSGELPCLDLGGGPVRLGTAFMGYEPTSPTDE